MSVLVVLEESGGKIKRASWEALAAAHAASRPRKRSRQSSSARQTEALAAEAAAKPLAKWCAWSIRCLSTYTADGFSLALHQLLQNQSPA